MLIITNKVYKAFWMQAAQLDAITTKQEEILWQTFFRKVLLGCKDAAALTSILKGMAQPHLQKFALAMALYLKEEFDPAVGKNKSSELLLKRSQMAQKFLQNLKRVL